MAFVFGCQLFRRDERRQGRPSLRRTRPPVASYVRSQYRVNPFSTRNFDRIYIHYDARCLYLPLVLHVLGPSSWRMLVVRSSTPRPSLFVNVLAHALQAGFVPGFLEQGECTACKYFAVVRRDARWRPCVPIRLCGWLRCGHVSHHAYRCTCSMIALHSIVFICVFLFASCYASSAGFVGRGL